MYCAACAEWQHAALDVQQRGRWLETEVFNTKGDLVGRDAAHAAAITSLMSRRGAKP